MLRKSKIERRKPDYNGKWVEWIKQNDVLKLVLL